MVRKRFGGGVLSAGGVLVGGFGAAAFPHLVVPATVMGIVMVVIGGMLVFGRDRQTPSEVQPEPPANVPQEKERALLTLRRARDNAAIAVAQRGDEVRLRVFHEIQAAMLSIKREFGISPLAVTTIRGTKPYKEVLQLYIGYIDQVYPMLREGHVEEGKNIGSAYQWTWVEEP